MTDSITPWRITFCKCWTGRFHSHIDMMRAWMRALRRTGMPIYYTRGYNPKPKISYLTPPLSVGQTSECEILDFRMEQDVMAQRLQDEIRDKAPSGTVVLDVGSNPAKLQPITRMDYLLLLQDEDCPMPDVDAVFLAAGAEGSFLTGPAPVDIAHVHEHKLTFSRNHHPAQFFDRAFHIAFRISPDGGSPVKSYGDYLNAYGIVHHLHRLSFNRQ